MYKHTLGPVRDQAPVLRFEIGRLGIGQGKSVCLICTVLCLCQNYSIPSQPTPVGAPLLPPPLTPSIALCRMAEDRKQEVLCTKLGPGK